MRFTRLLLDVGKKYSNARVLLGIESGASKKEIHSAYLKMAKEYHPDIALTADLAEKEAKVGFEFTGAILLLLSLRPFLINLGLLGIIRTRILCSCVGA